MKFFKADYLGEDSASKPQQLKAAQALGGGSLKTSKQDDPAAAIKLAELSAKQAKMKREYEKILKLDAELAHKTQITRELRNARLAKEQLLRETQEEEERLQRMALAQRQQEGKRGGIKIGGKPPSAAASQNKQTKAGSQYGRSATSSIKER